MEKMDPENMWRGTVPLLSRSDLLIAVIQPHGWKSQKGQQKLCSADYNHPTDVDDKKGLILTH